MKNSNLKKKKCFLKKKKVVWKLKKNRGNKRKK
jgi:hypothetical protein